MLNGVLSAATPSDLTHERNEAGPSDGLIALMVLKLRSARDRIDGGRFRHGDQPPSKTTLVRSTFVSYRIARIDGLQRLWAGCGLSSDLRGKKVGRKTFCLATGNVFEGIFKPAHRRRVVLVLY
jgi:hypothetical protein